MATSYSPSRSQWAPIPHGIDHNGYPITPLDEGGVRGPFMGDLSNDSKLSSRQRRTSSPGKRALQWFTRSRSNSPAATSPSHQHAEQNAADRSFDPPSPSSFVVRSVVKQPGGVSHEYDAYGNVVKPSSFDDQSYQTRRSQPLQQQQQAPQHSLIVPPGGPGGGTGYGTAKSTNDGRPERDEEVVERGRSRSKSPNRPASPGATKAGAFRPNTGRVSPGPMSNMQVAQFEEKARMDRHEAMRQSRKNSYNDDVQAAAINKAGAPTGPRSSPFASTPPTGVSPQPRNSSPLAIAQQRAGERFSMPVHIPKGSVPPPVIPLNGVPSPVKIGFSPNQMAATHSPFGSASPAGSPGFFDESNPLHHQQQQYDGSQTGSPNTAARWFKGLFGKSPRTEGRDDSMYQQGNDPSSTAEGQWLRNGSSPLVQQSPDAWSDGTPLAGQRQTMSRRDADEAEAAARKKHSMMMAARIEDEHRERLMAGRGHNGAPVPNEKEWTPLQIVDPNVAPLSPPQSKSPPGRKPAPRFTAADLATMTQREREQVAEQVDPENRLSRMDGSLTPAQQIIAETRSKMSANGGSTIAGAKLSSSPPTNVQRGFVPVAKQNAAPIRKSTNEAITKTVPSKGLAAGSGPLPLDMPMGEAMQEMMIRFYKFERYAVPLMRSLESRLVDVERDNQMALNGDQMSANSAREREMDRWVGQMTGLMRHEVGQLQAATREIRQAREILAAVATSRTSGRKVEETDVERADAVTTPAAIERNTSSHSEHDVVAELPPPNKAVNIDARRQTNISSSTFDSAVHKPVPHHQQQQQPPSSNAASNASPNGRVRYTSALGKPMQQGRISPLPVCSPVEASAPSPAPSNQSSFSRRAMSVDDRLKALMGGEKGRSPSVATSTNERSSSSVTHSHGASRSSNTSSGGASSGNTSFEKLSMPTLDSETGKIGDDYQLVTMLDANENAANRAQEEKDAAVASDQSNGHAKTLSTLSTATATTLKPVAQVAGRSLTAPSPMAAQSSHAPLSPNLTGNSLRLASAISTPTRPRRSESPINAAASSSSSAIKTASHATSGLRARAQSYLQNAESSTPPASAAALSAASQLPGSLFAASPTKLTSSVSNYVLRARDVNNVDAAAAAAVVDKSPSTASTGTVRSASVEEIVIRPLSIKKSAPSIKTNAVDASSANTVGKATVKSLPVAGTIASPARMSIKDRVAFFDAAQQRRA